LKRLICLLTLLLTLNAGICSAANWQWIYSDDYYGLYFDSDSLYFKYGGGRLPCITWVKWQYTGASQGKFAVPQNTDFSLMKVQISPEGYIPLEEYFYDDDDNVLYYGNYANYFNQPLTPIKDSLADKMVRAIANYTGTTKQLKLD